MGTSTTYSLAINSGSGRTRPTRRTARLGQLAAIGLLAGTLVGSAAPAQGSTFVVKGRGYGHGIGLSQYGAQGYALEGKKANWIIRHYYTGVDVGDAPSRKIGVLLTGGGSAYSFSGARKACDVATDPGSTYGAVVSSGAVRLTRGGSTIASCGSRFKAAGKGGIHLDGAGTYRGKLIFKRASSGLNVINNLDLDAYLKGVVPAEAISSWEPAALQAQAIAARSYALATSVNGDGYDVYDDVRSQVYNGKTVETDNTNAAVKATNGKAALYNGEVATTFFFSTSGGRTESIENAWPGSDPIPYLTSVKDEFDSISPVHTWSETITGAELDAQLGDWVKGSLQAVRVDKKGDSGRIVYAEIVGTGGTTRVEGPDLRVRLGLRSTWVRFERQ